MEAEIRLEGFAGYFRWICDVCGERQEKDGVTSRVVFGDTEFDICRKCLDAGQGGVIERLNEYTRELEAEIAYRQVEMYASLMAVENWKTGKDYDNTIEESEAYMEEMAEDDGYLDVFAKALSDDDDDGDYGATFILEEGER